MPESLEGRKHASSPLEERASRKRIALSLLEGDLERLEGDLKRLRLNLRYFKQETLDPF